MSEDETQLKLFAEDVRTVETTQAPSPPQRGRGWYARLGRRGRRFLWFAFFVWAALGLLFLVDRGVIPIGDGRGPPADAVAAEAILVVAQGRDPDLPAMFLAVHGREGTSVVLLPASTVVEVPGEGSPRSLAAALAETGPNGFATAVANVLGTRVPPLLVGTPDQTMALVDRLGGVEVDVPTTVEIEQDGRLRTVFTAGLKTMRGAEFLHFLTAGIAEQQEFDRVARQGAAWQGVFAAMASTDREDLFAGWSTEDDASRLSGVLSAAAHNPDLAMLTLPVRRVGVAGTDLYEVDRDGLTAVHRAVSQIATVTEREGRRVRLLVGAEGAMGPTVARQLIEGGFVIVLTGPASEPYDETRLVMAENTPELRETAHELRGLLGTGRLGVFRRPQSVFDVTLVIGRDWAEANGFPQPEPTPTPRGRR